MKLLIVSKNSYVKQMSIKLNTVWYLIKYNDDSIGFGAFGIQSQIRRRLTLVNSSLQPLIICCSEKN